MRPINVLYVPTTAETLDDCERRTVASITDLQRLVGGYVEEAHVPASDGVVIFGDEEAIIKDSPTNMLATLILDRYAAKAGMEVLQRIVGNVVFCSYDPHGNEGDVPEAFVSDLREHLPRTLA